MRIWVCISHTEKDRKRHEIMCVCVCARGDRGERERVVIRVKSFWSKAKDIFYTPSVNKQNKKTKPVIVYLRLVRQSYHHFSFVSPPTRNTRSWARPWKREVSTRSWQCLPYRRRFLQTQRESTWVREFKRILWFSWSTSCILRHNGHDWFFLYVADSLAKKKGLTPKKRAHECLVLVCVPSENIGKYFERRRRERILGFLPKNWSELQPRLVGKPGRRVFCPCRSGSENESHPKDGTHKHPATRTH